MIIDTRKPTLISTIILVALIALVSCTHLSQKEPDTRQLTDVQVRLLATRILENTPEYIHFDKGTSFSWVVLSPEVNTNPKSLRDEVIRQLQQRYTVYFRDQELPDNLLIKDENERLFEYRGGFWFSFRVEFERQGTVKVHYADWEAMLAASSHWERYKWTGTKWKAIEIGPVSVS